MYRPLCIAVLLAAAAITWMPTAAAQDAPKPAPQGRGDPAAQFRPMIEALRNTPGCLGVEAARLQSGKLAIFAFFRDKEAAKAWYYNPVHEQVMKRLMPDAIPPEGHEPMSEVPAGEPILAVATITPPANGQEGLPQISIELYTPMSGGLTIGSGFAPKGFAPVDAPATQPSTK